MPQEIDGKPVFSLYEVSRSIQKAIGERYGSSYWVKAEMNKLNHYRHSGHCYPELVEKKDGRVIAQIRANLWRADYHRINQRFLELLKEPLKDGIKILLEAKITYDPVHGLALWITDIDPGFTLGDLEAEKRATIQRLQQEGVYQLNKQHSLSLLPKRIAVISVETSKGWADFRKVLEENHWNYRFFYHLFPSLLQGDQAAPAIIRQLNSIRKVINHFDAVAIIRGGGGDVGLSCYNDYALANTIASFPIPVITGIGHATNETVVEMVSFFNAITPTKLAEFLIQQFHNFSVPVQEAEKKITIWAQQKMRSEKAAFHHLLSSFKQLANHTIRYQQSAIRTVSVVLRQEVKFRMKHEYETLHSSRRKIGDGTSRLLAQHDKDLNNCIASLGKDSRRRGEYHTIVLRQYQQKLELHSRSILKEARLTLAGLEKNTDAMSPANVLKRGYSITLHNGKPVCSGAAVSPGDIVQTTLFNGTIVSIVQQSTNTDHESEN